MKDLLCNCRECVRRRAEALVLVRIAVSAVIGILLAIGGCLLLTGCAAVKAGECEHGYSWRGDCANPLFKE